MLICIHQGAHAFSEIKKKDLYRNLKKKNQMNMSQIHRSNIPHNKSLEGLTNEKKQYKTLYDLRRQPESCIYKHVSMH